MPKITPRKLGKLSLAILENFGKSKLGEDFIEELRKDYDRAGAITQALEASEARFISDFKDKDLSKALFVDLKQKDRPALKDAVGKFYDHPTDTDFPNALQKILLSEFKKLSADRVSAAIDFYIELLTEELALVDDTFQENARALSDLRMVNILRRVEKLLANQAPTPPSIEVAVARALHQLPPAPADFTGRETELKQLLDQLGKHKGAAISGLTGMGGIGKTALGLAAAHKLIEKYPDAQLFLDLKGATKGAEPLSSAESMRRVILSFMPAADLSQTDEAQLSNLYQSILAEKRALLFLDNARNSNQIASLRPPSSCAMLVTSRWNFSVPGLQFHRVGAMAENDAKNFLLELCPRIDDQAAEIAYMCGYLPLALRIAGSFLREYVDWQPEEYIQRLSAQKLSSLKLEDDSELNVEASLGLSYLQLSESDQYFWRTLGVFPASFNRNGCAVVWEMTDEAAHGILSRFCRMSMLDYDNISSQYRLHDLLYEYANKLADSSESTEVSIKVMLHRQSNPLFLLDSNDFHPVNFDPESHIDFGADLVNTDPNKAIEYYSTLLNNMRAMPWILRDSQMVYLAEISCGVLVIAFRKIGENEKAEYFTRQAQLFSDLKTSLTSRDSGAGE